MNCKETQPYLPDFLDDCLDVERAEAIKHHLGACSQCADDMASLRECQRLVSTLPTIEAPVNFTRRVMTEIREQAKPPNLWERLTLPFRAHVPAQATAVILVAVLAAAIYMKEQKHRSTVVQPESSSEQRETTDKLERSREQPSPARSEPKQVTNEIKAGIQEPNDSARPKKSQLPAKPQAVEKSPVGDRAPNSQGSTSEPQIRSPLTPAPAPLQDKSSAAGEALAFRKEQALTAMGEATVLQAEKEKSSAAKSLSIPEERENSTTSSLSALRSGSRVSRPLPADYELAIRLKESERDDKASADRLSSSGSQSERRSLTSVEEAKGLDRARQQTAQTGKSQIIWITVARNRYESFKRELADLGNIEAEASIPERQREASGQSSEQLRVKVTFLPPMSSASPATSVPSSR